MTEAEFLDRLDTWALGGLSDVEAAAMQRFIDAGASERCVAAYRRAFATAALLASSLPPAPPPASTWDRIVARLPGRAPPQARRPRWWIVASAAVAAAAVLVIVLLLRDRAERIDREAGLREELREARDGAVLASNAALERCRADLEALRDRDTLAADTVALLELPGTQLIPLDRRGPVGGAIEANAIYHRGVKRAYVVAAGVGAPPAGGYQVWLTRAGERIAAGSLTAGPDGRGIVSVPTLTLEDGVPETFQIALATGEIVLESQIKI